MPPFAPPTSATGSNSTSQYAFDHGLLSVVDLSSASTAFSSSPSSATLQAKCHSSLQALLTSLIATLPLSVNPDHGPILTLPMPTTLLPRAKPLPKPKPLTKWQEFAKKKGIAPTSKKEGKLIYDEDTQQWVPKWGYKGANKKVEEQWIHEIPMGKDDDYDPSKEMKKERKKRKLHNEGQRLKNIARANTAMNKSSSGNKDSLGEGSGSLIGSSKGKGASAAGIPPSKTQRKAQLEADSLRVRGATASMGKFEPVLKGEDLKIRNARRSFQANEKIGSSEEKKRNMEILRKIERGEIDSKGQVNERKAVRFESKGQGAMALARRGEQEARGGKGGKRKR